MREGGDRVNTISKNFRAAYGDFWNVIGFLVSGVSIFNFLARTFQLDPSPLIQRLLDAFRSVFHPLIEFALGWMPFALTPLMKDGATLYFVMGGAVARTFLVLTRTIGDEPVHAGGDPFMEWFVGSSLRRTFGFVSSVLLWPIMLILFWQRPIVARFRNVDAKETRGKYWNPLRRVLRRHRAPERAETIRLKTYDHDLRVVFALQLLAALCVVAAMALETAAGV